MLAAPILALEIWMHLSVNLQYRKGSLLTITLLTVVTPLRMFLLGVYSHIHDLGAMEWRTKGMELIKNLVRTS